MCAPAHLQDLAAPLVVGLITEIRHATYAAARTAVRSGLPTPLVTLLLDEVANIAPLHDLPAMVSEAGGQGLHVLACLQDLSQARERWGTEAGTGFLSLFGTKVILGGIFDPATTQALSIASNEVNDGAESIQVAQTPGGPVRTTGKSTNWRPRLTPGDLTGILQGKALSIRSTSWNWLDLVPYWTT